MDEKKQPPPDKKRSDKDAHRSSSHKSKRPRDGANGSGAGEPSSKRARHDNKKDKKKDSKSSHKPRGPPVPADKNVVPDIRDDGTRTVHKKKSEFLCTLAYSNALPRLPADPKLLAISLSADGHHLTRYACSSLDEKRRRDVFPTSTLLGIPVLDLVPGDRITPPELDQVDQKLEKKDDDLEEISHGARKKKTVMNVRNRTSWLRKTVIVANDIYAGVVQMRSDRQTEAKRGPVIKEEAPRDTDKEVEEVVQSFEAAKLRPVHKRNSALEPVEVHPVLPDDVAHNEYVFAQFNNPPALEVAGRTLDGVIAAAGGAGATVPPDGKALAISQVDLQQTVTSVLCQHSNQHFGLYVPSSSHPPPLPRGVDGSTVDSREHFDWVREFSRDMRVVPPEPENCYFLLVSSTGVRYAPYRNRLLLRKRAKAAQQDEGIEADIESRPTTITLNVVQPTAE